ncbi:MAG: hypothetical protein WAL80_04110 [Xanthobacteraceae bacterium]
MATALLHQQASVIAQQPAIVTAISAGGRYRANEPGFSADAGAAEIAQGSFAKARSTEWEQRPTACVKIRWQSGGNSR